MHSSPVYSGPVYRVEFVPVQSSPMPSNSVPSRLIPFIPFQLSTFVPSITQVHTSQQQSSLVRQVQCRAVQSVTAQPSPVPSSPEQLTAVESSTTQSCSVKLGTISIAAREVKWSAIPKSPNLGPCKCISVQFCLQLSHQHNQERLLTALS